MSNQVKITRETEERQTYRLKSGDVSAYIAVSNGQCSSIWLSDGGTMSDRVLLYIALGKELEALTNPLKDKE